MSKTSKDQINCEYHEEREHWKGKPDFVLSSAGYSIGIGNIWRFPYLCYKNGGGAFLIPYIVFLIICAFPMFLLEYGISQFSAKSSINVWAICPMLKGAGYGMIIVTAFMSLYFNVMVSWILYYLYHSLALVLPWGTCNNTWNTNSCLETLNLNNTENNITIDASFNMSNTSINILTPSEEFWRHKVLHLSDGLSEMGSVKTDLLFCLFLAWVLTYITVCWGIQISGKIVYVTVGFPYIVLLIFLIKALSLPGSMDGIYFYIVPTWKSLLSTKVWGEAAIQIFTSSGMGYGGLITYASYNKFHNNIYRDSLIGPIMNSGTSIFAGFVTFSMLGFMANMKDMTIDKVVTQGPGLVFEAYPSAMTKFSHPQIWSVLFFLMMFSVAIDTQIGMVETILTAFKDEFPIVEKQKRILTSALYCLIMFLLGIPMVMQGGVYVLQIIDWYHSLFTVMIICILECVVIGWIYGIQRFNNDIEMMVGFKVGKFWILCWKYITPIFLIEMHVHKVGRYVTLPIKFTCTLRNPSEHRETRLSIAFFKEGNVYKPYLKNEVHGTSMHRKFFKEYYLALSFNMSELEPVSYGTYRYPSWAITVGWTIGLVSLVPLIIIMLVKSVSANGSFIEKMRKISAPSGSWRSAVRAEDNQTDDKLLD